MGQAWLAVCQRAAAGKLDGINGVLDSAAVKRLFDEELRKRAPRVRREDTKQV